MYYKEFNKYINIIALLNKLNIVNTTDYYEALSGFTSVSHVRNIAYGDDTL